MEKAASLGNLALTSCAMAYEFKQSTWSPHKKVEALVNEIRENGPLMVQALVGKPYYKDDPFEAAKVKGTPILGWRPQAELKENMEHFFHPILLVGARSDTKGHVYYVDALNESDPNKPRTIYVTTYEKLKESIATIMGYKVPLEDVDQNAPIFAYYSPKS